ncbi:FRG domain-containing protein [Arthrobacter mobilis]|uniref:FRG domain-containing protein n=1 Tax=Arthrobacter mobilis TaxID=2724944 RepID=A0A7X6K5Y5_9MICC|nr:FRG domain-containing protein [Arthrobacter mobilis]NKX56275.1 FRG domain-containing protein [Arthrobacter mobilis]
MSDNIEVGPWEGAWGIQAENLQDLWRLIGVAAFETSLSNRVVWRGLPDSSFEVNSSLVRQLHQEMGRGDDRFPSLTEEYLRQRELEILYAAREWAIGLSEYGSVTDLHLLAMLQHHGAPTRLVDVTYNPLTALWFACSDETKEDVAGVLVALVVPDEVVVTAPQVPNPFSDTQAVPGAPTLISALTRAGDLGGCVLVEPRPQDERMKAQEGLFLTGIYPNEQQDGPVVGLPWDPSATRLLKRLRGEPTPKSVEDFTGWRGLSVAGIVISPELKRDLSHFLHSKFNRSHRTMYPDMAGFVKFLKTNDAGFDLFDRGIYLQENSGSMPTYWANPSNESNNE